MGIDFIQKCAQSFKKNWGRANHELEIPDLFLKRRPKIRRRRYSGVPIGKHSFNEGDEVVVQVSINKAGVDLVKEGQRIGVIARPTKTLLKQIEDGCGAAVGTIEKTHATSGAADISVE